MNVGESFNSFLDFYEALQAFQNANFVKFYVAKSVILNGEPSENFKYKFAIFKCIHNGKFYSKSRGHRKTNTFRDNCSAFFRLKYCAATKKLIVVTSNNRHSHISSKSNFDRLPQNRKFNNEERQFVEDAISMKASGSLIANRLNEKSGKSFVAKDINNIRPHLNITNMNGDLNELYESLKSFPHIAQFYVDENNQLEGMFFQTENMRTWFSNYPEVVFIDATYKLNDRNMPLLFMCVMDGDGRTQIACLAVIKSENIQSLSKILKTFTEKNVNSKNVRVVIMDKSFAEYNTVKTFFPQADIQICIFHVLQIFRREVTTAKRSITKLQRNQALKILSRMVYVQTEEEYNSLYNELIDMNCQKLTEYFDENWNTIEMRTRWAGYFTHKYLNFQNYTNNRIESINQKLKLVVTPYSTFNNFVTDVIKCSLMLQHNRDHQHIYRQLKRPVETFPIESSEFKYRETLTEFAFTHVLDELHNMNDLHILAKENEIIAFSRRPKSSNSQSNISYSTRSNSCTCSFFLNMDLPCRHLMEFHRSTNETTFLPQFCHKRWLKEHLRKTLEETTRDRIMTENEKFAKANQISNELVVSLSQKPNTMFQYYMKQISKMIDLIKNNKSCAVSTIEVKNKFKETYYIIIINAILLQDVENIINNETSNRMLNSQIEHQPQIQTQDCEAENERLNNERQVVDEDRINEIMSMLQRNDLVRIFFFLNVISFSYKFTSFQPDEYLDENSNDNTMEEEYLDHEIQNETAVSHDSTVNLDNSIFFLYILILFHFRSRRQDIIL